jgi:hypothetical protein
VKTGKGLPAGPYGALGAAEGMAYLAVLAGIVVLGFQLTDYGFLPEAVRTPLSDYDGCRRLRPTFIWSFMLLTKIIVLVFTTHVT